MNNFIKPNWPAPERVHACSTTREGGFSQNRYASLNLAVHVEDEFMMVARNRALLREQLQLPAEPLWLNQVHGTTVVQADQQYMQVTADAAYTHSPNVICAVLAADCLPVLLCDKDATCVAAVHAGWRGLAAGIIEKTIDTLQVPGEQLLAWLGPAIGPSMFEVGRELMQQFVAMDPHATKAFKPAAVKNKWLADIYVLARQRLAQRNVTAVYGGEYCTYSEAELFYSYRRDKQKTGRMGSLIWLE